jgi:hypothetical protein
MHSFLQIYRAPALVLILSFVFSACGGPRIAAEYQGVSVEIPDVPLRPLPAPITPSLPFLAAVEEGTRTMVGEPGETYWQQDARYQLTARLLPERRRLEGSGRFVYYNNSPYRLPELRMEIAQNLHAPGVVRVEPAQVTGGVSLARVRVNGRALREGGTTGARYLVDGTQLILMPDRPVAPGDSAVVEMDWSFSVPQAGAGARMGYDGDDLFFLAYWYPIFSVFDDVTGWFTEPFRGRAEFYAGFADYELTVEAPEGWLVFATGAHENPRQTLAPNVFARLLDARMSDEPLVVVGPEHFEDALTQPSPRRPLSWQFSSTRVRDVAFGAVRRSVWEAARAQVGDVTGDGRPDYTVVNTVYRPEAFRWRQVTAFQQHSLSFLSSYLGMPYPWPHMTAIEGAGIIRGGMEYPMMTLMGDYTERGDSALYYVTVHELAHMWVPMIVGTNERFHTWLDEGMTTFNENEARHDFFPGVDHYAEDRELYLNVARADMEGEIMRRSDFHYDQLSFVVASYMKPATVMVALRSLIGEDTFNQAYREFLQTWAYAHPQPWDFFHAFERASGRDLSWFWYTWYHTTWTLDQAVADVTVDGRNTVIRIEDRGLAPMPARVVITLENGEQLFREVPVENWLAGAREASITVTTRSPVVRVEIDPENHFPDIDRENNVWELP